ncbi:MAG: hypothetical protein GYA51_07390 [Candidatus Methanofastidiosa archaeon]|jgi:hypothetical protein|nr:hypothetical protein [Candidatus Methanofastidiosa archaeon]
MNKSFDKKGTSCSAQGCPFCSKEGIVLASIGIIIAFLAPFPFAYLGILFFLSVYFIPTLKKLRNYRKD